MSTDTRSEERPERFRAQRVVFWGDQDGPPERELKDRLVPLFRAEESISRAYLARVSLGDSQSISVALCLCTKRAPGNGLVGQIGKIFASMFGRHEHLDIIFITDLQENELTKRCKPFFTAAS